MLSLILLAVFVQAQAQSHDGHDHGGSNNFEWAGIFALPGSTYMWSAQKTKSGSGLAYVDATMKLVALPASAATDGKLHSLESEGNHALEQTCTEVQSGGVIKPAMDKCYKLVFNQDLPQSLYTIDATGVSAVAFFTEHFPTEFENTEHYLKDDQGADIEPVAQLPESQDGHDGHDHGGHDGHDHGNYEFEWAGIFEVPENTYMWTAQKTQSDSGVGYVDATMKIALLPASAATDAEMHKMESKGNHAMVQTCTEVQSGGVIKPVMDKCYNLIFNQDLWQSLYTIDATGVSAVAIFAQHFPTEFENTAHYLKDDHGDDIEPKAELPESHGAAESEEEEEKHWAPAMISAIIVNLVTLIGVIFMVPVFLKAATDNPYAFETLTAGFAAGAIAACAFFLLLFEATHLIAVEHKKEVEIIWRWGTMILAGFVTPTIMQLFLGKAAADEVPQQKEEESPKDDKTKLAKPPVSRVRLVFGVLIGDFMHNLCDGIFVGAAFKGCGESFGWKVATGTILHELAQELSDYTILTGPDAKLNRGVALLLNFLSGTGILLGVIIVLSADVADADTGLLLAFGGGIYLHIAFTDCMPKLYNMNVSGRVRAASVLLFIVGAMAIGLVLLDHEHCIPPVKEGEVDPHAGHDHR